MVDQEWVIDNFDIINQIFTRLNKSSKNLSRDRKSMKENMDTPRYRAYYYIAMNDEKKKLEKAKTIGDRVKYNEDQLQRTMNDDNMQLNNENMKRCINILEDQVIVKDKQISKKDKLIKKLEKRIGSGDTTNQI